MKIKSWISGGHLDLESNDSIEDCMDDVARALDKAYAHEILGEVAFVNDNDEVCLIVVNASIVKASPEYAKELLSTAPDPASSVSSGDD